MPSLAFGDGGASCFDAVANQNGTIGPGEADSRQRTCLGRATIDSKSSSLVQRVLTGSLERREASIHAKEIGYELAYPVPGVTRLASAERRHCRALFPRRQAKERLSSSVSRTWRTMRAASSHAASSGRRPYPSAASNCSTSAPAPLVRWRSSRRTPHERSARRHPAGAP